MLGYADIDADALTKQHAHNDRKHPSLVYAVADAHADCVHWSSPNCDSDADK